MVEKEIWAIFLDNGLRLEYTLPDAILFADAALEKAKERNLNPYWIRFFSAAVIGGNSFFMAVVIADAALTKLETKFP